MSAEVKALLKRAYGARGRLKREAVWLNKQPAEFVQSVVDYGRKQGIDLPADAASWPAKRLLRACLNRSEGAQVRSNPIVRDEAFVCGHCGAAVPIHGRTARDHCPHCLRSLHVDNVPGDRAVSCHGILDPTACETRNGEWHIHYRCRRCGAVKSNRALLDGDPPDDVRVLARLSAGNSV